MESITKMANSEALEAMYRSLERMNSAISESNSDIYQAEVGLQQNLRKIFEELQKD